MEADYLIWLDWLEDERGVTVACLRIAHPWMFRPRGTRGNGYGNGYGDGYGYGNGYGYGYGDGDGDGDGDGYGDGDGDGDTREAAS